MAMMIVSDRGERFSVHYNYLPPGLRTAVGILTVRDGDCDVSMQFTTLAALDKLIAQAVALKAEMTATEDLDALRMDGDDMLTPKDPPDPLSPEWDDVAELDEAASETWEEAKDAAPSWDAAERQRRAALMADGLTEF